MARDTSFLIKVDGQNGAEVTKSNKQGDIEKNDSG